MTALGGSSLAMLLALGACGQLPPGVVAVELSLPADPGIRFARHLRVTTEEPTELAVSFTDGVHSEEIHFAGSRRDHDVALLGFKPDRTYEVEISLEGVGDPVVLQQEITTAALPRVWPDWRVSSSPNRMEPG